jgi:hypothetical protein
MITDEEINKAADSYVEENCYSIDQDGDTWNYSGHTVSVTGEAVEAFQKGAKFAQDKILENEELLQVYMNRIGYNKLIDLKEEREEMKTALIDYVSVCDKLLEIEGTPHLDHHFEIFEKHDKLIEKLRDEK